MTRQQHLAAYTAAPDDATRLDLHRRYFAQFVTPWALERAQRILDQFPEAKDPNDIPLSKFDAYPKHHPPAVYQDLRAAGDFMTMAQSVCILKEAVRLIIDARNPAFPCS